MKKAWEEEVETTAYLVALDISGFSNDPAPDRLLSLRMSFFRAVNDTRLFKFAHSQRLVKVHFLGDELRLAFHVQVGAPLVRDFIFDVFAALRKANEPVVAAAQTWVRGTVLVGPVTWRRWNGCDFLDGDLTFKAQSWGGALATRTIAVDGQFRDHLTVAGFHLEVTEHCFGDESGYLITA